MTPAIQQLRKSNIKHQVFSYSHEPGSRAYGLEASEKLGIPPEKIFKTLIVESDTGKIHAALVPVSGQLNFKSFSKAAGVKKTRMADKNQILRITGYLPGGVSPIAQKKQVHTIIDASALSHDRIYVSAGRRGLQLELAPDDLADLIRADFGTITETP